MRGGIEMWIQGRGTGMVIVAITNRMRIVGEKGGDTVPEIATTIVPVGEMRMKDQQSVENESPEARLLPLQTLQNHSKKRNPKSPKSRKSHLRSSL